MAAEQVVEDFKALLEKSQSFFNGLRDLPQYENKQWKMFYEKTFEVYTALWKYQQDHRAVLENPEYYGLKRWQIGEIASKIGQLYYHYYLRTSDTLYLKESYVFYEAIRKRGYFQDVMDEQSVPLVVKMLRYLARYALVCLLLDRRAKARELMEELAQHSDVYTRAFDAPDGVEWANVTEELRAFLAAGDAVSVVGEEQMPLLPLFDPAGLETRIPPPAGGFVELQVAVLVGAKSKQIRFSEMPLELFRLATAIEATAESEPQHAARCPTKHLHFCPSFEKLFVSLASVSKELPQGDQGLLVYLSGDASDVDGRVGLALEDGGAGSGTLFPEDLSPFLRRSMCVVLDCPAASAFSGLKSGFGKACVVLMAPPETPAEVPSHETVGSLFTMFLSQPLQALATACHMVELEADVHVQAEEIITSIFGCIYTEMQAAEGLDPSLQAMMKDPVLCNLVFRFAFFDAVARTHVHFSANEAFRPTISPPLPAAVTNSEAVQAGLRKLGAALSTGFLEA